MARGIMLGDDAQIVVVGGGPAGSFFALHLLQRAREIGKRVRLQIVERKRAPGAAGLLQAGTREGCNYCAGGISPRMADELFRNGLGPPDNVVQERVRTVTMQSEWKNIELVVPQGRIMLTVFRGSRPIGRADRYANFDSFLLGRALEAGASLTTGEVRDIRRETDGRLKVVCTPGRAPNALPWTMDADFVVIASGVNHIPGMAVAGSPLFPALKGLMPGFRPPAVRKTLIFELEADPAAMRALRGEVFFIDYGSGELDIEMSSLIPKGHYITGVLIGRAVERADPTEHRQIIKAFMELPHIRRLAPGVSLLPAACVCSPNITIGTAKHACADRIAVIGDLAVSRLYKDGIYSAFLTARALAEAVLRCGVSREQLERDFWPAVRKIGQDNIFGRAVFFLNRAVFSKPVLSRIFYQAILTERKSVIRGRRRLETVLWKVLSGDDAYRNILLSMLHPAALFRIVAGGLLVTVRNCLTELLLGLKWREVPKYPTGLYRELVTAKREELSKFGALDMRAGRPQFERMYAIKIRAACHSIWRQLGKLGDGDREFLKLRFITISRLVGEPNAIGSLIAYRIARTPIGFRLRLESAVEHRRLLYRVVDGFPRGGILVLDIEDAPQGAGALLTIYVAFNFPSGRRRFGKMLWGLFRLLFPAFAHDVAWNHALCKLKQLAESEFDRESPADSRGASRRHAPGAADHGTGGGQGRT